MARRNVFPPARSSAFLLLAGLAAALTVSAAPGVLLVHADAEFAATAFLDIELTPGDQFDRLEVAGDLTLDGELRLTMPGNFLPEPEDTFVVITAQTISGTFSNEVQGRITLADGSGSMQISYGATAVTLSDFVSLSLLFRDGFENE